MALGAYPRPQFLSYSGMLYAGDARWAGGVKADGTTNDTAAMNAAIAAAAATGLRLILPVGQILVTSGGLVFPNSCAIEGQCNVQTYTQTALLTVQPYGTYIIAKDSGTNPIMTPAYGSTIRNLQVFSVNQTMTGINMTGGNILLDNVSVLNCKAGLDFDISGNSCRVHNCRFSNNITGILNPLDSHFINTVINANTTGVYFSSGCNFCMFAANRIEFNGNNVVMAGTPNGAGTNTFVGNTFDRSGGPALSLTDAENCTFSGNIFLRSGANASTPGNSTDCHIYMANCIQTVISSNTSNIGAEDDGSGYLSPYWAIYDGGGNTQCILSANSLGYHNNSSTQTAGPINTTATFNLATNGNLTFHN